MKVFVVGNIGVDETFMINELPAKGASIHGIKTHQDLGGKGANQAIILSRCGIDTTLVAALGNDTQGQWCRETINREPLTLRPDYFCAARTDSSLIFTCADGDNAIITTTTAAQALSLDDIHQALSLSCEQDVVLQQGNFSAEKTEAIFRLARENKLTTVFNPSPLTIQFKAILPLVDILVVNQLEAQGLSGVSDIALAATSLLEAGVGQVIITLGADGALLLDAHQRQQIAAAPVEVVDTTGAGDTFLAVMLASALKRRLPVCRQDLVCAAMASAITIGRTGTLSAFPNQQELADILAAP